ncbi:EamA family transporter [Brevibacillus daliensis]|uniref:EamA family transporter n=1 Tax=Brevibacillus daliensis TaxID=2892995 RepID=UPI001E61027A|nr:EamA family transporter [Brevibacillus daliensis]
MDKKRRAYLDLTLAMVIVGSSVVVGKLIVDSFPVFLASGLRYGLASVMLVALLLLLEKGIPALSGKEVGVLLLQSRKKPPKSRKNSVVLPFVLNNNEYPCK